MLNQGKRVVAWNVAFMATLVISGLVSAAESQFADEDRWIPSVGMSMGFVVQEQSGNHSSLCESGGFNNAIFLGGSFEPTCQGDFTDDDVDVLAQDPIGFPGGESNPVIILLRTLVTDNVLRPVAEGSSLGISPQVSLNLQLASPVIPMVPGHLRGFASAELQFLFPIKRPVSKEGGEGEFAVPRNIPTGRYTQQQIRGTGATGNANHGLLAYKFDLGLVFPFEMLGRHLRLKPSVGYGRFNLDLKGSLQHAVKDDWNSVPGGFQFGVNQRFVILGQSRILKMDGIGPGLELEMDAMDLGPTGISLFVSGNAYKVLGNRDVTVSDSRDFFFADDGIIDDTYRGEWNYHASAWIYRLAVGVRIHYLGKK